jgi:hypothetical protein
MQIDTQWMSRWFTTFNQRYFDGKLPVPLLKVGRSRTRLGSFSYKVERRLGRRVETQQTITLSRFYDLPEHEIQSVLLHEMIHYVIYYTCLKDTSAHGVIFRGMMDRLNRDGWDIRVSHRNTALSPSEQRPARARTTLVMSIRMADGSRLLSAVNPHYARGIDRTLKSAPTVSHVDWYVSNDAYFADRPQVRSPRGFKVSESKYQELLGKMTAFNLYGK